MGDSNDNEMIQALNKIEKAKELLDMGAINQEEFDKIKSKYLQQVYGANDSHQEMDAVQKTSNQSTEIDLDYIYGIELDDESQLGKKSKKSAQQKAIEKAASQARNTAAREVTKGIMRGIFGQMK